VHFIPRFGVNFIFLRNNGDDWDKENKVSQKEKVGRPETHKKSKKVQLNNGVSRLSENASDKLGHFMFLSLSPSG